MITEILFTIDLLKSNLSNAFYIKNKLIELDTNINELRKNNKISLLEHNEYLNYRKIILKNLLNKSLLWIQIWSLLSKGL